MMSKIEQSLWENQLGRRKQMGMARESIVYGSIQKARAERGRRQGKETAQFTWPVLYSYSHNHELQLEALMLGKTTFAYTHLEFQGSLKPNSSLVRRTTNTHFGNLS